MGITYGNIVLYRVNQSSLIKHLSVIGREAYVSPTINNFTVVYDKAVDGPEQKDITKLIDLDSNFKNILKNYGYDHIGTLVCLTSYLSKEFKCVGLAIFIWDATLFWYHLSRNGQMLDEYTTNADDSWNPGKPILKFCSNIKGGNSQQLCQAFNITRVQEVETILRKSNGGNEQPYLLTLPPYNLSYYLALLTVGSYCCKTLRHEALARALGICPGWVVGLNYLAIETGEFVELWNDFCSIEGDDVPMFENADLLLKKTRL